MSNRDKLASPERRILPQKNDGIQSPNEIHMLKLTNSILCARHFTRSDMLPIILIFKNK